MTRERLARQKPVAAGIKGRVFLVGCPRSGTTLLQSLLSSHSAIHSVPETHFLQELFHTDENRKIPETHLPLPKRISRKWQDGRRTALLAMGWVGRRRSAKAWNRVHKAVALPETRLRGLQRFRLKAQLGQFTGLLDSECRKAGKRIWLEKTPDHLFYAKKIQQHIPDAKVIHIVRDGEEVVASLYRAARNYPDWRAFLDTSRAIERWNAAWRESLSWVGKSNHLLVQYEMLMAQPNLTMAHILEFIGCEYESRIWNHYTNVARRLINADEPWKESSLSIMCDRRKFTDAFGITQQQHIREDLDKPDWDALSRNPSVIAQGSVKSSGGS